MKTGDMIIRFMYNYDSWKRPKLLFLGSIDAPDFDCEIDVGSDDPIAPGQGPTSKPDSTLQLTLVVISIDFHLQSLTDWYLTVYYPFHLKFTDHPKKQDKTQDMVNVFTEQLRLEWQKRWKLDWHKWEITHNTQDSFIDNWDWLLS